MPRKSAVSLTVVPPALPGARPAPPAELHGYRPDIGLDGFPTDPDHPFNRVR
jgi:hypothetical protein